MKSIVCFSARLSGILSAFLLQLVFSCSTNTNPKPAVDPRAAFVGNWCWNSTINCGGSPLNQSTPLVISLSTSSNQVSVLGFLSGTVSGSTITIIPATDSYGDTWSGYLTLSGITL
jgi:hypothetical protein